MDGICSVDGCDRPVLARGYCSRCYSRWRKHGDPTVRLSKWGNQEDRFWGQVDVSDEDGCWPRLGRVRPDGYTECRLDGVIRLSHIVSLILSGIKIPDEYEIDHLCHTNDPTCMGGPTCLHRRCVRPSHLEPVPPRVNFDRGHASEHNRRKTHCPQGHPYDAENTDLRNGRRHRKACRRNKRNKTGRKAVKLTDANVIEIRRRYNAGNVTQKQLAVEFGATESNISVIVTHRSWKHLP